MNYNIFFRLKRSFKGMLLLPAACLFISALASCSNSDEPTPAPVPDNEKHDVTPEDSKDRTVLVYAVAANDLLGSIRSDSLEMLNAAKSIEGLNESSRMLLYFSREKSASLSELVIDEKGNGKFETLVVYDLNRSSTDPVRIRKVIDDAKYLRPAAEYGIIFESHGSGWSPEFITHSDAGQSSELPPVAFSFGSDKTLGSRDAIDITELADVFYDDEFDFIWFDACYMANIETMYQMRNKAHYYAGYVTEINGDGMPYDKVLPLLVKPEADMQGAAQTLYDYYNRRRYPVTVSVMDLHNIERVAETAAPLVTLTSVPFVDWLQSYHRYPNGPFYDFRQYVGLSASNLSKDPADIDAFNQAMDEFVVYKAISSKDFNGYSFDKDAYGGVNCHVPGTTNKEKNEEWWLQLDWAKRLQLN